MAQSASISSRYSGPAKSKTWVASFKEGILKALNSSSQSQFCKALFTSLTASSTAKKKKKKVILCLEIKTLNDRFLTSLSVFGVFVAVSDHIQYEFSRSVCVELTQVQFEESGDIIFNIAWNKILKWTISTNSINYFFVPFFQIHYWAQTLIFKDGIAMASESFSLSFVFTASKSLNHKQSAAK